MKRLMLLILLTLPTLAQTHDALTAVIVYVDSGKIAWEGVKHKDSNDSAVKDSERAFIIDLPSRTMSDGMDKRLFEIKEQLMMIHNVAVVGELFGQAVDIIPPVYIAWNVEATMITPDHTILVVGKTRSAEIFKDGSWKYVGDDKQTELEEEVRDQLFNISSAVMQYCLESVEWWDSSKGEPLLKGGGGQN